MSTAKSIKIDASEAKTQEEVETNTKSSKTKSQEESLNKDQVAEVVSKKDSSLKFRGNYQNYKPIQREAPLMTDAQYLEERLNNQIDWYDRKSSVNQTKYKKYKRLEFIIAATIPVVTTLSAVADHDFYRLDTILQICAALGGIVLVIINKFLELDDYFKFWKEYRATCEALQYERSLYLTRSEPYDEDDAFPLLVQKIESVLSKETQRWQQRIKQVETPTNKKAKSSSN
ncbi:MAG: DUF4231 domain-containing protein [Flammeovirgaceae bacterium]|nr:DUF4231 domain-containing protein [Flammeovirgaceae bacterium]